MKSIMNFQEKGIKRLDGNFVLKCQLADLCDNSFMMENLMTETL